MLALDQKGQVSHTLPFALIMIAPQNFKQSPGRSHGQDRGQAKGGFYMPSYKNCDKENNLPKV